MPSRSPQAALYLLITSQFAGTSLWFASNAIIDQIASPDSAASITSFVQFGFISGTLVFSLFTIADRYSSRTVFFVSALIAALANLLVLVAYKDVTMVKLLRLATGFFLAGIYPVGMKIAADVFPEKLGKALGLLVGALVLGTSFPHFVRSQVSAIQWQTVVLMTSFLAVSGGCLVFFFMPARQPTALVNKPDFLTALRVFRTKDFRSAAFGYFGHMWELYAFWSILPGLFAYRNAVRLEKANIFWWSFLVIGVGSLGCVLGGFLSARWGSKKVAATSLVLSGLSCVLVPLFFPLTSPVFYSLMLFWGLTVTADSPQFSALVAKAAETKNRGTALTIVTSVGFAITIVSILLLKESFVTLKEKALWLLAPGPLFGWIALQRYLTK